MRLNYKKSKIDFLKLDNDPISFFMKWFNEILEINKYEANACVLSTISSSNKPSSRVVLLKDMTEEGFVFFTNYNSEKSIDIESNNNVALNFYWPELERQVRIKGRASRLDKKSSDDYFKSRPRESQMSAWLSDQSSEIDLSYDSSDFLTELESKFRNTEVDRPLYWGGYNITAHKIEFWQGRPSRFHDRILYELDGKKWNKKRLAP